MSFRFIRDHADRWPIRLMCRVLEVSASGFGLGEGRKMGAKWPATFATVRSAFDVTCL